MMEWCQSHLQCANQTTNDYTSFDQSQHGEAVVLEVLRMQRLCIPQELIDFHVEMKTSISTQFGPLTCMRLTGEPGTYDDNSDYNLAVIYSQYNLNGAAVMVSGDDSCIDGVHSETVGWPIVTDLLHLRFKTEVTSYPLFVGIMLAVKVLLDPLFLCLPNWPLLLMICPLMTKDSLILQSFLLGILLAKKCGT